MRHIVRIAIAVAGLSLPVAAFAQSTPWGKGDVARWTASDRCAQRAQKAFPDYTAESNAKRDAQLKLCLASGGLPPRSSLDTSTKP
jgi:hypothetical protein